MLPDAPIAIDWDDALLGINTFLLGVVLALGGYIWRKAIGDLDKFRDTNREEHEAFMERIGRVESRVSYIEGRHEGEHSWKAAKKT